MQPSTRLLSTSLVVSILAGCSGSDGQTDGSTGGASSTPTATATITASDPTTGTPTTSAAASSGDTGDTSGAPTTGPGDATTEPVTSTTSTDATTTTDAATTTDTTTDDTTTGEGLWNTPNLWYSVDKSLVYVELDPADGSVVQLVHNELVADMPLWHGQNGLTMLEDGTLLGSRESEQGTQIFHIAAPSVTADTPATAVFLGAMAPRIEALFTDCEGRIYLMDTGEDVGTADGNRLLRFTGKYLQGDLAFEVITDLQNASVGDIDDMSPGIFDNEISDGLGFAMDSSVLWKIDYTTGTGMQLADTDGTWGIHALGGPLFADDLARLYILSSDAELMRVDLADYASTSLITGPDLMLQTGYNGWSGLAGPLTECETTIPQ